MRYDLEDIGMAGIYLEDPWVILAFSQSSEGKPGFIQYTFHHGKCILSSLGTGFFLQISSPQLILQSSPAKSKLLSQHSGLSAL